MTQRRMGQQVGEAGRADPTRAHVLVPVEARPTLGLRVVEVDHHQPMRCRSGHRSPPRTHRSRRAGRGRCRPPRRAPHRGRTRSGRRGCHDRDGLRDRGELGHVRAQPEPAAGRVLQHHHRRVRAEIVLRERQPEPFGQPLDADRDAGAEVRPDVDVEEPGHEPGRRPKVVGEHAQPTVRRTAPRGRRG